MENLALDAGLQLGGEVGALCIQNQSGHLNMSMEGAVACHVLRDDRHSL